MNNEFPESKRTGLGGSEVCAAMGYSLYQTPYGLWRRLLALEKVEERSERQEIKSKIKPVIIEMYESRHGLDCIYPGGELMRHPDCYEMVGRVSAFIPPNDLADDGMGKGILLAETAHPMQWKRWEDNGEIPEYYLYKMYHYMAITGLRWGTVAFLIGNDQYFELDIVRGEDEDRIIEQLVEFVRVWWDTHIVKRIEPEAHTTEDLKKKWPTHTEAKTVALGEEFVGMHVELNQIQASLKKLSTRREEIKAHYQMQFEDAEVAIGPAGEKLATFKTSKDRLDIDKGKLQDDFPDAYIECQVTKLGARVMRFTKGKS